MKPKQKVKIVSSAKFWYAIGLIVTDGSLSKDRRHVSFTSKDIELVDHFQKGLGVNGHVGKKARGGEVKIKKYFVVEFSDVVFYRFLLEIGLTPAKTKTMGTIAVPDEYFFDFLRGHLDGDGSFYSYFDPRWKSSYMFYLSFISASSEHIMWLRGRIQEKIGIRGHVSKSKNSCVYQLRYAKKETLTLVAQLYYNQSVLCLSRKRVKIEKAIKLSAGAVTVARLA